MKKIACTYGDICIDAKRLDYPYISLLTSTTKGNGYMCTAIIKYKRFKSSKSFFNILSKQGV